MEKKLFILFMFSGFIAATVFAEVWTDLPLQAYPLGKRWRSFTNDAKWGQIKKSHVRKIFFQQLIVKHNSENNMSEFYPVKRVLADTLLLLNRGLLLFSKVFCSTLCWYNKNSH